MFASHFHRLAAALLLIHAVWQCALASAEPLPLAFETERKDALDALVGPLQDGNDRREPTATGAIFTEFQPTNERLLRLIDAVHHNFGFSQIGQAIYRDILNCDSTEFINYLGISGLMAQILADDCTSQASVLGPFVPEVNPSSAAEIRKLRFANAPPRRTYAMILTSSQTPRHFSWTTSNTNHTYLLLPDTGPDKGAFYTFLHKILAHETAIYLDAKMWACGRDFQNLPNLRNFQFQRANGSPLDRTAVCAALNNPLIAQVMAFIRAFHIEKRIISELVTVRQLPPYAAVEYQAPEYAFLEEDLCNDSCLREFAFQNARSQIDVVLPLLAFSPAYRRFKMDDLNRRLEARQIDWVQFDQLQKAVDRIPSEYFDLLQGIRDPFAAIINPAVIVHENESAVRQAFADHLLPEDWDLIAESSIVFSDGTSQPLLRFMARPLLSGLNTNISLGPRPRIRSGATGGGVN